MLQIMLVEDYLSSQMIRHQHYKHE